MTDVCAIGQNNNNTEFSRLGLDLIDLHSAVDYLFYVMHDAIEIE